ncbi:hypothetical protein [Spiroplasma poulsonii]|uniref:hypothetical protein n=1 Tax=Spiroplasma poulsonii TaxID=2138 RepID=UPI00133133AE|nr:hypothetical protein [Spiroplasma poulsonii]
MRKIKKELKIKYFLSTMHVGVDEEKSTKNRKKMKKKKGVFQMMNKNHKNKNDKSKLIILLIKFLNQWILMILMKILKY